jgi:DUF1365 family protein
MTNILNRSLKTIPISFLKKYRPRGEAVFPVRFFYVINVSKKYMLILFERQFFFNKRKILMGNDGHLKR